MSFPRYGSSTSFFFLSFCRFLGDLREREKGWPLAPRGNGNFFPPTISPFIYTIGDNGRYKAQRWTTEQELILIGTESSRFLSPLKLLLSLPISLLGGDCRLIEAVTSLSYGTLGQDISCQSDELLPSIFWNETSGWKLVYLDLTVCRCSWACSYSAQSRYNLEYSHLENCFNPCYTECLCRYQANLPGKWSRCSW